MKRKRWLDVALVLGLALLPVAACGAVSVALFRGHWQSFDFDLGWQVGREMPNAAAASVARPKPRGDRYHVTRTEASLLKGMTLERNTFCMACLGGRSDEHGRAFRGRGEAE